MKRLLAVAALTATALGLATPANALTHRDLTWYNSEGGKTAVLMMDTYADALPADRPTSAKFRDDCSYLSLAVQLANDITQPHSRADLALWNPMKRDAALAFSACLRYVHHYRAADLRATLTNLHTVDHDLYSLTRDSR